MNRYITFISLTLKKNKGGCLREPRFPQVYILYEIAYVEWSYLSSETYVKENSLDNCLSTVQSLL